MLRTNLATRPFYNERLVHWLLGAGLLLVAAFTAYNVSEYLRLTGRQGGLAAEAARDEAQARALNARAADARRRIDRKQLEVVAAQATEVNGIIDARTFSWTSLFDDIEATLPPTVMLTAITPKIDQAGASVRLIVVGRTVEAIDTFIERLEATKRFADVRVVSEQVTDEGLFETQLAGRYLAALPPPAAPPGPPAPAPAAAPGTRGAR
jgi:Tfp pilus assembly protein PilN